MTVQDSDNWSDSERKTPNNSIIVDIKILFTTRCTRQNSCSNYNKQAKITYSKPVIMTDANNIMGGLPFVTCLME